MRTAAIILSGGQGSRVGFAEKGLLEFQGEPLIGRKLSQLQPLFNDILIVVNKPALYQSYSDRATMVVDDLPYQGPLRGLYCGMQAKESEWYFVTAVDMPFFVPALVDYFSACMADHHAIVAKLEAGIEPLFGFYHRQIMPRMAALLQTPTAGLRHLLETVNTQYISESAVKVVDPELQTFYNINTQEDY